MWFVWFVASKRFVHAAPGGRRLFAAPRDNVDIGAAATGMEQQPHEDASAAAMRVLQELGFDASTCALVLQQVHPCLAPLPFVKKAGGITAATPLCLYVRRSMPIPW